MFARFEFDFIYAHTHALCVRCKFIKRSWFGDANDMPRICDQITNMWNAPEQRRFYINCMWKWKWPLTHWGRVTHICVGKLTIIGSDNGLSPERRQAIIWTNAGILLIGPLGTNFSEILIEIQTFSLKKIRLKMSSAKCCSFRLGLNVLT